MEAGLFFSILLVGGLGLVASVALGAFAFYAPDKMSKFFWSRKNIAGMSAFTLVLLFGLLGPLSIPGAFGTGLLAYSLALFTPNKKVKIKPITTSSSMEDIIKQLSEVCDSAEENLPYKTAKTVDEIQGLLIEIMKRSNTDKFHNDPSLETVRNTALEWLPLALQEYFDLPTNYATKHKHSVTGRTALEELDKQLGLLKHTTQQTLNAVLEGNASGLAQHGRFLEEKLVEYNEFKTREG